MGKGTVRAAVAAAVTAGLALCTAGCGGDEQAEQPVAPSTSSAPSESPSASPSTSDTPDPTPSAEPLSRFEDRAPVQAARRWAGLLGRAVNREERSLATAAPVMTQHGRDVLPGYMAEDFGLYYPGPLPFTPTSVKVKGKNASIALCVWSDGFALKHKGGLAARKKVIDSTLLTLSKQRGRWKFDDMVYSDSHSCKKVPVKGIGW